MVSNHFPKLDYLLLIVQGSQIARYLTIVGSPASGYKVDDILAKIFVNRIIEVDLTISLDLIDFFKLVFIVSLRFGSFQFS